MLIGHIEGANVCMRGDGRNVADLFVLQHEGRMISAWLPTPAELAAMQAGAPVYLSIYGDGHPPVYVGVKDVTT